MSQIDVLLAGYADRAAALADSTLAPFLIGAAFDTSRVFDNGGAGIQIWSTADDTSTTATDDRGATYAVVAHQYQAGYALIVSYADPTIPAGTANPNAASIAPFKANANCVLLADRDAANAGNAGFLYYAVQTSAQMTPMRLQPTPLGSNYPFGAP